MSLDPNISLQKEAGLYLKVCNTVHLLPAKAFGRKRLRDPPALSPPFESAYAMTDHTPAFCRNRPLSVLPLTERSQIRRHSMHVQRLNGQGLHDAGKRIEQVLCVKQSFASMVTAADADGDLLRAAMMMLVKDDELVRECQSERLTDCTKENVP